MNSAKSQEGNKNLRREQALIRCKDLAGWYEKAKRRNRIAYQVSQVATVVLSGATPILILLSDLPKVLQALPAALVTMIVGLSGIFQWRDNYIRFAYTSEALKSEKVKFETRTTGDYSVTLSEARAIDNFITPIEALAMSEVSEWRSLMQETAKLAEADEGRGTVDSLGDAG